ncbi:MAG: glycoside hydrolase family 9 protein, partial [Cytophagales bacterium]|nr:glycoside hydrolase family 9 protein [Cytophagales bacterium]
MNLKLKFGAVLSIFLLSAHGLLAQTKPEASTDIRLNQVGFYPNYPKMAIIKGGTPGGKFFLKDINDNKTVFEGRLSDVSLWDLSNENVRIADFSGYTNSGTFYLEVPTVGNSYPFSIDSHVHHSISKASLKAFYFNRVSIPLESTYAGIYARPLGHPDLSLTILPSAASETRPAGTVISSPKGWYDAGDYNSYIVNSGISTYTLLSAYQDYKTLYDTLNLNIPESNNQIPDILDEIKWNLDWMLTMQDPTDGGVYNKKTNANFDGFIMPDKAINTRYITAKGTAASFDFAAVMAVAYRVYKPFDPAFAQTCLKAAKAAYDWGVANPSIPFTNPPAQEGYPAVVTGEYGDGYL